MTVTALSGSMLTVNAEEFSEDTWSAESVEVTSMPGGGTKYTIVSEKCITYGSNGVMENDGANLGSTGSRDEYFEITLPALTAENASEYDTIVLNMSTTEQNQVSIEVKIGEKTVASKETFCTAERDWAIKPVILKIDKENYTPNKDENIKLCIKKAGNQNYCGNYQSVEFYNEDAEREAEIAEIAFDIDEVVKAREITRTYNEDRFGTLSEMQITSEENYPSVFGEITSYTECCDYTEGYGYYYVSVDTEGEYSFAILAEGSSSTDFKVEKVNGTGLDKVVEYSKILWTKVGNCKYNANSRDLSIYTTPEIKLEQGLYKVTLSPGEAPDNYEPGGENETKYYYCDFIAIAGISASEPEPEPEPTQPTAELETANWSVEGSNTGYDVNQNKLTVDGETVFGYKATFSNLGSTTYTTVKATVKKAGGNETDIQTQEKKIPELTLNDGGVVFYIISNAELDTTGSSIVLE